MLKGSGTTGVLYRHATFSPLPCFYSVLNSPSEKAQSSILFLYPSFALRRRSLSSSCLITSEARVACINLDWQDSEAWNALCRTSIKGRHSGDVALMECGSDSFNYLLTRCKPVALRDGLLGRMFSPSSRYDDASGIASRRAVAIFVSSRRVEVKVKSDTSLDLRTHGAWKFPLLLAATWLPPQALQSMNIWDNLPVPFTFYIRQTLNPVWDAFTAIWSLLSHSPQHTHTHRHFTSNAVPNPACMAASIFHNASCTSVRYGPWFHLCEGMVALLSAPEWNSCGSMSLTRQSQTDGVFTCCTAAASGSCGYTGKLR